MNVAVIDNVVAKVCRQRGIKWQFALTSRCRLAVRKMKTEDRAAVVRMLERVISDWARQC